MDNFRKELMEGIVEIALETNMSVNQCIIEAKSMLREEVKKEFKKAEVANMFKGWQI